MPKQLKQSPAEDTSARLAQNKVNLQNLAERLALNNVNISLWDLTEKKKKDETLPLPALDQAYEDILANGRPRKAVRERNIVIVGAGASKNACQELPLGAEASKVLFDNFKNKTGADLLETEMKRLAQVYRLPPDDFETKLYAISRFDPKGLKEELFKLYNCRYNPNLTYEILAHLFKHRFIDVIVNFNFDELLDQAIADELSPGEYQHIISDGEYDEALMFDQGGLRYPVYIKPHGSVSHKSSMRFTREDYFGLPADIEDAIKKLINPDLGANGNGEEEITVNLIVVGFNMQSFEFNLLLNEHLPEEGKKGRKVHFYFFHTSVEDAFFNKGNKEFPGGLKKRIKKNSVWIKVLKETNTLDNLFNELWNLITQQFGTAYQPRNIARHKLIATIFENEEMRKETNKEEDKMRVFKYLHDRTLIEFALSLAKYMGFVCIEQLVSDRFGKYFKLLQRREQLKYQTIPEYCGLFQLVDFGYGSTTFYWPGKTKPKKNLTKSPEDFMDNFFPRIYRALLKETADWETKDRLIKHEELLKETMKTLTTEEDTEVSPVHENPNQNVFRKPKPVKTKLALAYCTRYFLSRNDYDKILIVAETGEWLLDLADDQSSGKLPPGKKFHLIIADEVKKPKETLPLKVKSAEENIEVDELHWWMHNQHMTVFLKWDEAKQKWRPIRGIYFDRRQRSTHINPVILTAPSDLKIIVEAFAAYHFKSKKGMVSPKSIKKFLEEYDFEG